MQGAKICVIDTRLSNTASMADWWLSPWPGSEAALLLAIARLLVLERRYDRDFVRRNPGEPEFLQAVREVARDVMPIVADRADYRDARILERLAEPDRAISPAISTMVAAGMPLSRSANSGV